MKATVLKTDRGTRLFWTFQDSNENFFDAEAVISIARKREQKGEYRHGN